MVWLSDGEKTLLRLAVSIENRYVIDGWTDGQTDGHSASAQFALCKASPGENHLLALKFK